MTLREEFTVHMLNDAGKTKAVNIAHEFNVLLSLLEDHCGSDGRSMAVVRTKLEEACFFAKKAMASRQENQA